MTITRCPDCVSFYDTECEDETDMLETWDETSVDLAMDNSSIEEVELVAVEPVELDLSDESEWPELPSPTVTNEWVDSGTAPTEDDSLGDSWCDVSLNTASSSNEWDIVSAGKSYATAASCPKNKRQTVVRRCKERVCNPPRRTTCHKTTDSRSHMHEEDSYDGICSSIRDASKSLRGGKAKFMFKGNQRTDKGCGKGSPDKNWWEIPPCRACKRSERNYNRSPIHKRKVDVKQFCSRYAHTYNYCPYIGNCQFCAGKLDNRVNRVLEWYDERGEAVVLDEFIYDVLDGECEYICCCEDRIDYNRAYDK